MRYDEAKVGMKVKVIGGNYAGREGTVSKEASQRPEIDLGGCFGKVRVSCFNLKKIEEPKKTEPYKVGDYVRRVNEHNGGPKIGSTGVIKKYRDDGYLGIAWDNFRGGHGHSIPDTDRNGWWVPLKDVGPYVAPAPVHTTRGYIVAVEKDGRYAPATTPKEYGSEEQALAVAQSMADRHGGKFYVLQPVAFAERPLVPKAVINYV